MQGETGGKETGFFGYQPYAMSATSKYKEAAWELIKCLMSEDVLKKPLYCGLHGVRRSTINLV
jgi:ABC-type glycerol-3-phosphate transport system substrate-binding protein